VAGVLGCLRTHRHDHGIPGQYYCCHAERQLFIEWREITHNDGTVFFKKAAKHYGIKVYFNNKRYQ
jgi:hypothetical protein